MSKRVGLLGLLLVTVVACGGESLSDSAWVWCNDYHAEEINDAADALGLMKIANFDYDVRGLGEGTIREHPDFIETCHTLYVEAGEQNPGDGQTLTDREFGWCYSADYPNYPSGLELDRKADELGLSRQGSYSTQIGGTPSWEIDTDWWELPPDQQRSNTDFVRACNAAFEAR